MMVGAGTALALFLAKASLTVIVALSAGSIPRFHQPQINGAVFAFAVRKWPISDPASAPRAAKPEPIPAAP